MFILLEKDFRGRWASPCHFDEETFDSEEEALQFADENDLVDVAVFEFKCFP